MEKKKEITIYDLAKELNVSASTVSRALKGHSSIGKKTTRAVKKLAEEWGYRPNNIAASLRKNRTNNIGIIVPWINRPFISALISGVEAAAKASKQNVIISQSRDKYQNEIQNVAALFESRISGLIVSLAMETQTFDHFQRFTDNNIPLVFVDRVPKDWNCHKVVIDNYAAGFKATQHLIEKGCKRIAHFGGALHQYIYDERQKGYIDALKKSNLPIDETLILRGDILSAKEGIKLTKYLLDLENPPDGIFSANDTSAVSAIQYAKSKNLNIPDDLAIIGFNNDPVCLIIDPQLSSITHPAIEMGKIALQQAMKIHSNDDLIVSQTITLKTELIERKSSSKSK